MPADGLKLRAEANAASTVLRKLGYGTHLTATGQPTAPDAQGIAWQNVRTADGQSGWVAAQFVSSTQLAAVTATPVTASGTAAVPFGKAGYVYVAAPRGLTVRAEASADSTDVILVAYGLRLDQRTGRRPGCQGRHLAQCQDGRWHRRLGGGAVGHRPGSTYGHSHST